MKTLKNEAMLALKIISLATRAHLIIHKELGSSWSALIVSLAGKYIVPAHMQFIFQVVKCQK